MTEKQLLYQAAVFFIPICKNVVIAYCVWLTFYQNYVYSI